MLDNKVLFREYENGEVVEPVPFWIWIWIWSSSGPEAGYSRVLKD